MFVPSLTTTGLALVGISLTDGNDINISVDHNLNTQSMSYCEYTAVAFVTTTCKNNILVTY